MDPKVQESITPAARKRSKQSSLTIDQARREYLDGGGGVAGGGGGGERPGGEEAEGEQERGRDGESGHASW
jgi:hypothetical protein